MSNTHIAELPDHLLKDIGIGRGEIDGRAGAHCQSGRRSARSFAPGRLGIVIRKTRHIKPEHIQFHELNVL